MIKNAVHPFVAQSRPIGHACFRAGALTLNTPTLLSNCVDQVPTLVYPFYFEIKNDKDYDPPRNYQANCRNEDI